MEEKKGNYDRRNIHLKGDLLSIYNSELTLNQVTIEKIDYVIKNEVRKFPYITWISRNQMLWGEGIHFKGAKEKTLRYGILDNSGVSKPSRFDLDYQKKKFGYSMNFPPDELKKIFTSVMKKRFVNESIKGKYSDLFFLYGKGFIDSRAEKLIIEYGNGIFGYFVMLKDKEKREEQQIWLESQPIWLRLQWERCSNTYDSMLESKRKSAITMESTCSALIAFTPIYKELDSKLSKEKRIAALIEYNGDDEE